MEGIGGPSQSVLMYCAVGIFFMTSCIIRCSVLEAVDCPLCLMEEIHITKNNTKPIKLALIQIDL